MKLNTWLIIAAINWVFFGLGGLFTPQYTLPNITDNPLALALMQHVGSGALVLGLLAWFTRRLTDSAARQLIISIFILALVLSAIVNGLGIINGALTSFDWLFVGIDVLLALGFVYFRFIKPE
jgi:hypothetical protein